MQYSELPEDLRAFIVEVSADLFTRLLGAVHTRIRTLFTPTAKQQALRNALGNALATTFSDLVGNPDLFRHYLNIFVEWGSRPRVIEQLELLINPHPKIALDVDLLHAEFEAAGYDLNYLGLPFDDVLRRFVGAYFDAAAGESELEGVISIQLLRGVVEEMGALSVNVSAMRGTLEDDIAPDVRRMADDVATMAHPPDPVAVATQAYLKRLVSECNDMPDLVALGVQTVDLRYRLDKLYVDLDIADPQIQERQTKRDDAWLGTLGDDRESRQSAVTAAAAAGRLVLLGDPGSGKSIFVRRLATQLALAALGQADPPTGWQPRIPLLMTVRLLGPRLNALRLEHMSPRNRRAALRDALFAQWREELTLMGRSDFADHIETILEGGNTILIFDGLDEISSALRPLLHQAIQALAVWYDTIPHILVTCRVRSYPTDVPLLPDYRVHKLAPFSRKQIDTFVERWYKLTATGPKAAAAPDLIADLQRNAKRDALIELSEIPLLLTAMAILHQRGAQLPSQRVKIYTQIVDILLVGWQKSRGIPTSEQLLAILEDRDGQNRLRKSMERLGFEAHMLLEQGAANADLTRAQAHAVLQHQDYLGSSDLADQFLTYVDHRAGLLIGRGGDDALGRPMHYAFPHRTFLEYLAGCYLLRGHLRENKRAYTELTREQNDWNVAAYLGLEELLYNRRREGDVRELAYHLTPLQPPSEQAQWRGVIWAAHAAALIGRDTIENDEIFQGASHLQRLLRRLQTLVTDADTLPLQLRAEAGRLLGKLGDERPGVGSAMHGTMLLPDIVWGATVPAGEYTIGDENPKYDDEKLREAPIERPFALAQYPVTVVQFNCFVQAADVDDARWWMDMPDSGKYRASIVESAWLEDNRPRETVTWYQAVAFCRWLDHHYRVADLIRADEQIALPHEYEWEVAARYAGNERCDRRLYPWGSDDISAEYANYDQTKLSQTSAVGLFPAGRQSELDLYDMSGNVWEWCRNKYDDPQDEQVDQSNTSRTLRGGSWADYVDSCRAASRHDYGPNPRNRYLFGFRVCVRRPTSHAYSIPVLRLQT